MVIDDGGAVEVWCGDGGAVGIMPSLKSLKKTNGWKEIIKKYYFNKNRVLGYGRYCKMIWYKQ